MILQFNDGNSVEIESFGKSEDLSVLSFFLYTEDFNTVKTLFTNKEGLSSLTIGTDTYNNYTTVKSMTADICEDERMYVAVQLAYCGLNEQMEQLKEENENLSGQIDMLTECILEMSELLYA